MRKGINFLQRSYNAYGSELDLKIVNEVSGHISDKLINEIIEICSGTDFISLTNKVKEILNSGYSSVNVLIKLYTKIIESDIPDLIKSKIIIKFTDIDYNLVNGCDESIQLIRTFTYIMKCINQV